MPKIGRISRLLTFFIDLQLIIIIFLSVFFISSVEVQAASSQTALVHRHRGSSDSCSGCYTVPVYHSHLGNTSTGGACYSPIYHSHSSSCYSYTNCVMRPETVTIAYSYSSNCYYHGTVMTVVYNVTYLHDCSIGHSTEQITVLCPTCGGANVYGARTHTNSYLSCGKSSSTVEGYRLSCSKTEGVTVDSWDLGCGLDNDTSYGSLSMSSLSSGWTSGNVTLTACLDDPSGVLSRDGYGAITFSTADGNIVQGSGNQVTVSENGTYTASVSINDALFDSADSQIMLTVDNIDRTAPQIDSIDYDTASEWLRENTITVSASDLQPGGSPGSGFGPESYSFDGGTTWQADNTYTVSQAGTVNIAVRDICGNAVFGQAVINNIDNTPPSLDYTYTPAQWLESSGEKRIYVFTVSDSEAGMPADMFSYDGGQTWTSQNTLVLDKPEPVKVIVRDILGNCSEISIQNEYYIPPVSDPLSIPGGNTYFLNDGESMSGGSNAEENGSGDDSSELSSEEADREDESNSDHDISALPFPASAEIPVNGLSDTDPSDDSAYLSALYKSNTQLSDSLAAGDDTELLFPYKIPSSLSGQPEETIRSASVSSDDVTTLRPQNIDKSHPFYKSRGFKTVTKATGTAVGLIVLLFFLLMQVSGVRLYSFDGKKYRFIAFILIHRNEKGRYIRIADNVIKRSFSSRYRIIPGPVYIRSNSTGLLYIHMKKNTYSLKVEKIMLFDAAK